MRNLWLRCMALALLSVFWLSTVAAAAAKVPELNYFQTKELKSDGREIFRLEIGAKTEELKYNLEVKPHYAKQIVLDIANVKRGKLKENIELKSKFARRVNIIDDKAGRVKLRLTCNIDLEEDSYKVYTLPADRKQGKPARIVIEVGLPPTDTMDSGQVSGVKGRTIVLDPGHGGSDSGAVGPNGVTEKAVTLAVSARVKRLLQSGGAKVIMTRETDKDVYGVNATDKQELQARVNVGLKDPSVDIFVSVHCNAFANPAAHGTETFYYADSERGKILATLLNEELIKAGGRTNRGVKTANFYVIRHSPMPASLVELAFITNYEEERLLKDPSFQDRMALAIAKGISRYFAR